MPLFIMLQTCGRWTAVSKSTNVLTTSTLLVSSFLRDVGPVTRDSTDSTTSALLLLLLGPALMLGDQVWITVGVPVQAKDVEWG